VRPGISELSHPRAANQRPGHGRCHREAHRQRIPGHKWHGAENEEHQTAVDQRGTLPCMTNHRKPKMPSTLNRAFIARRSFQFRGRGTGILRGRARGSDMRRR